MASLILRAFSSFLPEVLLAFSSGKLLLVQINLVHQFRTGFLHETVLVTFCLNRKIVHDLNCCLLVKWQVAV